MVNLVRPSVDFQASPAALMGMQRGAQTLPAAQPISEAILAGTRGFAEISQIRQQQAAAQQRQDLTMRAMQGDVNAQQELMATDPTAALQLQQAAQEQQQAQIAQQQEARAQQQFEAKEARAIQEADVKQQEREKKEIGRFGNVISVEVGENKRQAVQNFYNRIQDLGGDPAMFGFGDKDPSQMSIKELNQVGKAAQAMATDPLKQQELVIKQQELALKKEDRQIQKLKDAAEANKLPEMAPPIKDPDKGRADFTALSKDFRQVRAAYDRIIVSAEDPSAAGDLALIFNYMKMLDPGSTVREGEFATAQNSGSVGQRIIAQYNKVKAGERLGDTQRLDFVDRSNKLFSAAKKNHLNLEDQFTKLADKSNIDPAGVVLDFLGDHREDAAAEVPQELSGMTDEQLMQMWGAQ